MRCMWRLRANDEWPASFWFVGVCTDFAHWLRAYGISDDALHRDAYEGICLELTS